jgi:protein-L-isoaspartate(D-aspartate) O-methyltransferase
VTATEAGRRKASFNGIVVTAAPLEIPTILLRQLSNGGRLVAPVGPIWNQELIVLEKRSDGTIQRRSICGVSFLPMKLSTK